MELSHNAAQDNRQKILDAAAQLFANKGFNGVSVREIAESAGVTKPVIYYYFESKEDLHQQLFQSAYQHTVGIHANIFDSGDPVETQMRELMRSHFRFCKDNPDMVKILYDTIGKTINEKGLNSEKPELLQTDTKFKRFSDFVRLGQEKGTFKPSIDPVKAGMMFLGSMNIFILTHLHSNKSVISDEVADELMEILLKGLLADNSERKDVNSDNGDETV